MGTTTRTDTVAVLRDQFKTLDLVGRPLQLDEERQRRVLLIDRRDWPNWSTFLQDGPLPSHPEVSVMLRRLGAATYRLATLAERRIA